MNQASARTSFWLLLASFAVCVWGALAYVRMPVELLPQSRQRVTMFLVKAPGYSAKELDARLAGRLTPLFRRQGFDGEVTARFLSHGFSVSARAPAATDLAERISILRTALTATLTHTGIVGATIVLKDEPLADRTAFKIGFLKSAPHGDVVSFLEHVRALEGVTAVAWTAEEAAWLGSESFSVASVERAEHASPVNVSRGFQNLLAREKFRTPSLAQTLRFADEADYIRASESNLFENIVSGTLLTVLCVFVFLRAFASTFLVGVSIPVCVLLSVPFLYALGVTRNVMSLAGLALSVGIVVDASLSIVGNFDESMATGRFTPPQAAWGTIKESFKPLLLATLTTLAVFAPILFLEGRVGELFSELSTAVIVSNLVGFVVSIVIMPCLLLHFRTTNQPKQSNRKESGEGADLWTPALNFAASTPLRSFVFIALSVAAVALSLSLLPAQEFLPPPREGRGFAELTALHPSQVFDLARTDARDAVRLKSLLEKAGATETLVFADMGRVVADFDASAVSFPSLRSNISSHFPLRSPYADFQNPLRPSFAQRADVRIAFEASDGARDNLAAFLRHHDGVAHAHFLSLDREPVAIEDFDLAPELTASSPRETERRFLDANSPFLVAGNKAIAHRPTQRLRIDERTLDEVELKLAPGATSLALENDIHAYAKTQGIIAHASPETREAQSSLAGLGRCLALAIGIIFLLLWAQNRSATKSLIILATFAWSAIGAVPALHFHDETLNGSALVGFILLAGTIVNNGILLMDRIEKNVQLQMAPFAAAVAGVRERSLNVIITSLTTVLAMLPLIWGGQEGAQMYRSLSIVVVYGTIASTPVSFIGIPALLMLHDATRESALRWKLRLHVARLATRRV